jgi:hypothetical protein
VLYKFNSVVRICIVLFLIVPIPAFADHVPTQTPYGISIACDSDGDTTKGDVTVTWQESDGFESSPPERYAIAFSNDNFVESNYAVASTPGWETALSYKSYVFTASYRENVFGTTADTFYAKVRSDNDTDQSYSEWTSIVSIDCDYGSTPTTTTTVPPAVPNDATNVSVNYQGKDVYFAWEYTDGNTVVNQFHINYSYDNSIWDRVIITDTTARTYTLDYTNIQTGTFYWTFSVCGDIENGESCTDSDSNNFETTQYVAPTTTVYVAPPPPPPPPPPTPEEIIVDVKVEGVDKTYTQADVNDGTIERDQERIDNEKEYGCFMTNAQIERGDCDIPEPKKDIEIVEEEVIIVEDEVYVEEDIVKDKKDVEDIVPKDDDPILDTVPEEIFKEEVVDFKEPPIEIEIVEFDLEDITPEDVVEIPIQDEVVEDELDKEIPKDDFKSEKEIKEEVKEPVEVTELTEEQITEEISQIEDIVNVPIIEDDIPEEEYEEAKQEAIQEYVQDLTEEEVVEVLEEVNDVGVQNLDQATQEVQDVVQAVVEEAIADVQVLTEEQVETVAKVLNLDKAEDVAIVAEAVKNDEAVAEAVEVYVAKAVENKDVEDYTLADVVTEVQTEQFLADPIGSFIDIQVQDIDLTSIGNDMTDDQKEKAQEVVVPVIIASQIIASVSVVPVRIRRT